MNVAEGSFMLMYLLINSVVVFSITLIITKSKILAHKRKFVAERYISSKISAPVGWFHRWWHAIWTCPMCSGFWISVIIACFYPVLSIIIDSLFMFGINWILHCIENYLFNNTEEKTLNK